MKILRYFCAAALAMTLALSAQAKLRELPAGCVTEPSKKLHCLSGTRYFLYTFQ